MKDMNGVWMPIGHTFVSFLVLHIDVWVDFLHVELIVGH